MSCKFKCYDVNVQAEFQNYVTYIGVSVKFVQLYINVKKKRFS